MVFDTTSSNTAGRNKGSALAIEATLGLAILWLACHHNIYEICVKHVSNDHTLGTSKNSPSGTLFKRFQREWDSIQQDTTVSS
jgi:hypothetical protein